MDYLIRWKNEDARGSADLISGRWLTVRPTGRDLTHATLIGRNVATSHFHIERDGDALLFRYGGRHAAANKAEGIYRGDMLIDPTKLADTTTISWRQEGSHEFERLPVAVRALAVKEGSRRARTGTAPSRSGLLARMKRAEAQAGGALKCDACGFTGHDAYGDAIGSCFDVHHRHHLADGERTNGLDDLALLCACCHRAVHALGDIPFSEFSSLFSKT
ncbi:HNH endonuclease [Sphingomonas taxi]|uniref:HNH endonuclease n=1 Tax=Sphingomonas taxi TaxID=1549858 RepID=UPI0009E0ACE9|nr:HNH endonuclease [Sphingomonas taxi]